MVQQLIQWNSRSAADLTVDGRTDAFQHYDEELIQIVSSMIIHLGNCQRADVIKTVEAVCENYPELRDRWGNEHIMDLARLLHKADISSMSDVYTERFREFNARYFGGKLPPYRVRIVLDLHSATNEPQEEDSIRHQMTRLHEQCIYLRYTDIVSMPGSLLGEMAYVATHDVDEAWWREMTRLKYVGAPIG